MAGNGKKADYEAMGDAIAKAVAPAIAKALAPQFGDLRKELQATNGRLDQMNSRLDQIVENTGGHYRRLEERVSRLESKVFPEKS